ncbi:MAG TPA: hypothetical protein DDZ89_05825 [Clostridiales bacterium]|nr:hypothetical protein [Clostridiales bacterium]
MLLRKKLFIKIFVSDRDEQEFIVLVFCIFNIILKRVVYSKEQIWCSARNYIEKKEEEKPDNYSTFIIRSYQKAELKLEKIDCLLNFTTDEKDLIAILTGISNIINGIAESFRKNKDQGIYIRLTVNQNTSYIECILSARLGKIIILILKYVKDTKILKKRRDEYVTTSY